MREGDENIKMKITPEKRGPVRQKIIYNLDMPQEVVVIICRTGELGKVKEKTGDVERAA